MSTSSSWFEASDPRSVFPPVTGDIEMGVAIISGGMAGLTSAYLLAKAGKRVTLLEQDKLYLGDSGRTTPF